MSNRDTVASALWGIIGKKDWIDLARPFPGQQRLQGSRILGRRHYLQDIT